MNFRDLGVGLADYIDAHHPRLGSTLMKLRFGGFRTVRPDRTLAAALLASGVTAGLALRRLGGRRGDERHRIGIVPASFVGVGATWLTLWRIDDVRWRRSHVTLVLDLPSDQLDLLVAQLRAEGAQVERHDSWRRVGGGSAGLSCRLRDLRRVNAAIDAFDPFGAEVAGQPAPADGA